MMGELDEAESDVTTAMEAYTEQQGGSVAEGDKSLAAMEKVRAQIRQGLKAKERQMAKKMAGFFN